MMDPVLDEAPFGIEARRDFSFEAHCVYLNNGATGVVPIPVLKAQQEWQAKIERQPIRYYARDMGSDIRKSAAEAAKLMNANPDDVVLVHNATTGTNAVLGSLKLSAGDEVLITTHAYIAVRLAAEFYCGRAGATVTYADLPFPMHDEDAVVQAIAQQISPRTKLVILDHITSVSAYVFPLTRLIPLCRRKGALVLIDAAHAPGQLVVDLAVLQPDFYVGNAHKWLSAAKGCAMLYVRPEHQAWVHPPVISTQFGLGFTKEFDYIGILDYSPFLSLPDALRYRRERFGSEQRILARNHALAVAAGCYLARVWGMRVACGGAW
jgi:isopenicillin-N epimerase